MSTMKTKQKPARVLRSMYIPADVDKTLREMAARDRRSVTQTVAILLEQALERFEDCKPAAEEA